MRYTSTGSPLPSVAKPSPRSSGGLQSTRKSSSRPAAARWATALGRPTVTSGDSAASLTRLFESSSARTCTM